MTRRALWRYAPVLAWMGVIFFFSAQPTLPSAPDPSWDFVLKKMGHVTVYAVLMLLLLRVAGRPLTARRALACFAVLLAFAFSDEWHQSFVPGRAARLTDVLIFDAGGGLAGLFIARLRSRRLQTR
jgi:VanZ family protein